MGNNHQGLYDNLVYLSEPTSEIIVLRIPSHIGIDGNESADKAVFPTTISNPFRALLKQQNTELRKPKYCNTLTGSKCILLARLRVDKQTNVNTSTIMKELMLLGAVSVMKHLLLFTFFQNALKRKLMYH